MQKKSFANLLAMGAQSLSLSSVAGPDHGHRLTNTGYNNPPPFPTHGSNRKAALRREGKQCRHGKAARK